MRGRRPDSCRKQRDPQRMIVDRIVTVIKVQETAYTATCKPSLPSILVEPPSALSWITAILRTINLVQGNRRLTRCNPLGEELEELVQSGRRKVDYLRQVNIVKLLELVSKDRMTSASTEIASRWYVSRMPFFFFNSTGRNSGESNRSMGFSFRSPSGESRPPTATARSQTRPDRAIRFGDDPVQHAGQV